MKIKSYIPNIITLFNLFSGCIALKYAFDMNFEMTFIWVCIGILFDFFDGFFARLFKVQGTLGLQLDSLADMVTSGVVPGTVMYLMLQQSVDTIESDGLLLQIIPFLGYFITLGSCYRLAKFNIDTRQTDLFIGLPTPANALFILSLPLVLQYTDFGFIIQALSNSIVLLGISFFSVYILNAEITLFSLKIKKFDFKIYRIQIVFISISVVLLILFHILGVSLLIISYVILSLIKNSSIK